MTASEFYNSNERIELCFWIDLGTPSDRFGQPEEGPLYTKEQLERMRTENSVNHWVDVGIPDNMFGQPEEGPLYTREQLERMRTENSVNHWVDVGIPDNMFGQPEEGPLYTREQLERMRIENNTAGDSFSKLGGAKEMEVTAPHNRNPTHTRTTNKQELSECIMVRGTRVYLPSGEGAWFDV